LRTAYDTDPATHIALYFIAALIWTVCSLPAATILMLVAGAMFGAWLGTFICVLAMSVGAVISLLLSRFLFRSFVRRKFAVQAEVVEREYERNGTSYLIAMRLTPVMPYFVANVLFGLTDISALRFFVISMVATIPIKFIYANAGSELSQIESVSDIFTGRLIVALVALALLPFIGRYVARKFFGVKVSR
jgi:uncharacterized membrane protein YdjX (TVP38/TMEM64 family)